MHCLLINPPGHIYSSACLQGKNMSRFSHWSELWTKTADLFWKCSFILCQQVVLSEQQKYNCFPGNSSTKCSAAPILKLQRSCLFNESIAFWSLIVTLSLITILVFPSQNLRPLEIIIKTFLTFYGLKFDTTKFKTFKDQRKPCNIKIKANSKYINNTKITLVYSIYIWLQSYLRFPRTHYHKNHNVVHATACWLSVLFVIVSHKHTKGEVKAL